MSMSHFFLKCLNATTPLTCTLLANEYPYSNEISEKNGTVPGDCIACDALFYLQVDCLRQDTLSEFKLFLRSAYHLICCYQCKIAVGKLW